MMMLFRLTEKEYELFKEYLTASEKAELESMRANYSSIQERLSVYEEKEQKVKKEELIASKDYEAIKKFCRVC